MDGHYGNAMTEIALALAMAFFSLMVLTLVSMGAGPGTGAEAATPLETVTAALKPSAPPENAKHKDTVSAEDVFVIYADGRFLDNQLNPVAPESLPTDRRIVLAIDPGLPLAEAVEARGQIKAANLVISTLDARWRKALADQ